MFVCVCVCVSIFYIFNSCPLLYIFAFIWIIWVFLLLSSFQCLLTLNFTLVFSSLLFANLFVPHSYVCFLILLILSLHSSVIIKCPFITLVFVFFVLLSLMIKLCHSLSLSLSSLFLFFYLPLLLFLKRPVSNKFQDFFASRPLCLIQVGSCKY